MVDITLDVSSSETGEKVILDFEYDETLIETIKEELPVQKTNYGYHRCDDEDSPLYGYYDEDVWFVDRSIESLSAVEETLGFSIPSDFWPESSHSTDECTASTKTPANGVKIEVQRDLSTLIVTVAEKVNDELREILCEYGENKGELTYRVPIGLYQDIVTCCNDYDTELTVVWPDVEHNEYLDSDWKHGGVITTCEKRVVNEILNRKIGYVRVPRNAEKTMVVSRFIFEVNTSVLIVTPTKERAESWCDFLSDSIAVETSREFENKDSDVESNTTPNPKVVCMSIDELDSEITDDNSECGVEIAVFDDIHQLTSVESELERLHEWLSTEYRVGVAPTIVECEEVESDIIKRVIGSEIDSVTFSDVSNERNIEKPIFERVETSKVITSDSNLSTVFDADRITRVLNRVNEVITSDADNNVLILVSDEVEAYLLAAGVKMNDGITTYRSEITQNNKERKRELLQVKSALRTTEITDSVGVSTNRDVDNDVRTKRVVISTNPITDINTTFDTVMITHDCELSLRDMDGLSRRLTGKANTIIDVIPDSDVYSENTKKRKMMITEFFELNDSNVRELQYSVTQQVQKERKSTEKAT